MRRGSTAEALRKLDGSSTEVEWKLDGRICDLRKLLKVLNKT
jgi:hypothetical protein